MWVAGQMTDSAMLTFTLRRLRASVILLAPFLKLQKKFLRQVLTIFGGADKAPRLQALLFIRQMAAMLPPPALELALKVSPALPSTSHLVKPSSTSQLSANNSFTRILEILNCTCQLSVSSILAQACMTLCGMFALCVASVMSPSSAYCMVVLIAL